LNFEIDTTWFTPTACVIIAGLIIWQIVQTIREQLKSFRAFKVVQDKLKLFHRQEAKQKEEQEELEAKRKNKEEFQNMLSTMSPEWRDILEFANGLILPNHWEDAFDYVRYMMNKSPLLTANDFKAFNKWMNVELSHEDYEQSRRILEKMSKAMSAQKMNKHKHQPVVRCFSHDNGLTIRQTCTCGVLISERSIETDKYNAGAKEGTEDADSFVRHLENIDLPHK
jgi:ABC-type nickel/cobalt efflux system permease component RcnA